MKSSAHETKSSGQKKNVSMMIYCPVEVEVGLIDGKRARKIIRGALFPKKTIEAIVRLIDKSNSNGLKGKDAVLLIGLKDASASLDKK